MSSWLIRKITVLISEQVRSTVLKLKSLAHNQRSSNVSNQSQLHVQKPNKSLTQIRWVDSRQTTSGQTRVCFGFHAGPALLLSKKKKKNHNFLFNITTGVLFDGHARCRICADSSWCFFGPSQRRARLLYTERACSWTYQKGTEQGTAEKS